MPMEATAPVASDAVDAGSARGGHADSDERFAEGGLLVSVGDYTRPAPLDREPEAGQPAAVSSRCVRVCQAGPPVSEAARTRELRDDRAGVARAALSPQEARLEDARAAIRRLTREDIDAVTGLTHPKAAVARIVGCLCIALGEVATWRAAGAWLAAPDAADRIAGMAADELTVCAARPRWCVQRARLY